MSNEVIIFIYSDGFKQEFPTHGKHTQFKGICHAKQRPIKALVPNSLKEFGLVINNIGYCLHPVKGVIGYYE
jgi:hypothetical protein